MIVGLSECKLGRLKAHGVDGSSVTLLVSVMAARILLILAVQSSCVVGRRKEGEVKENKAW